MRRTVLILLAGLTLLGAPGLAHAQSATTGGVSLMLGPGFSTARNPTWFQMGPKGWLWLGGKGKAQLGLVMPVMLGLRNYRSRFFDHSETTVDLVPGVRGALALHEFIRPYAEIGVGVSLATHSTYIDDGRRFVESETWAMPVIRTAVGLDLTPKRLAPLVLSFEAIALHARLGPVYPGGGTTLMVLFGIGFEL